MNDIRQNQLQYAWFPVIYALHHNKIIIIYA